MCDVSLSRYCSIASIFGWLRPHRPDCERPAYADSFRRCPTPPTFHQTCSSPKSVVVVVAKFRQPKEWSSVARPVKLIKSARNRVFLYLYADGEMRCFCGSFIADDMIFRRFGSYTVVRSYLRHQTHFQLYLYISSYKQPF